MSKTRLVLLVIGLLCLLAAGLLPLACGKTDRQQTAASAIVIDSVPSADSVIIYYQVEGEGNGPALVFVHGWSGDRTYWRGQIDAFKKDFKTVAIDLAGHGASGLNREDWTVPAYGADVAAVVNRLGLNQIILIGHSMGGAVIVEAARLLPEQTLALVGVDTYQDLGMKYTEEQAEDFLAPFKADFKTATDQFIRSFFPTTADSALVNKISADICSAPVDVAMGSFYGLFRYDPIEAMAAMRKPIRTVNSDVPPTNVEGNKKLAESFEIRYMPGYGHFLHLENPDKFNALLKETIAEFVPVKETPEK